MKLTESLLLITMLAGVAVAQAPATKGSSAPAKTSAAQAAPKAAPPVKPAASTPAKPTMPATKPEHVATKPHTATKPPVATKPAVATKHTAAHAVKAHAAKTATTTAEAASSADKPAATVADATADVAPEIKRGRDPFVSVIMERSGGVACSGAGKKCLMIDQVMLKGVVRSQGESIAVVSSSANKTYFLRENDPVYNGVVVKITPDSIVFRESVTDRLGKTVQREVVKKVNNSAV